MEFMGNNVIYGMYNIVYNNIIVIYGTRRFGWPTATLLLAPAESWGTLRYDTFLWKWYHYLPGGQIYNKTFLTSCFFMQGGCKIMHKKFYINWSNIEGMTMIFAIFAVVVT